MTPYTKGPWRSELRQDHNNPPVLGTYDIVGADGYGIAGIGVEEPTEETDTANARLIAAAPELLEALKIQHPPRENSEHGDLFEWCKICALINRAEPKQ